MESKRFSKNDSGFICQNCGKQVMPLGYTSRNHCPFCLYSLHLDISPGDRKSECGGLMEPVSALPDPKKGYIIVHRCKKCGELPVYTVEAYNYYMKFNVNKESL